MSNKIDKQLLHMPLDKLKELVSETKKEVRKNINELKKRRTLIQKYKKLQAIRKKIKQGKVIRNKLPTPSQKIKKFEDYFEEYIKNKKIPQDTPYYLLQALKRVIKEHDQGIEMEKSALNGFAKKYNIKGESGITLFQFLIDKKKVFKDFLRNNRNIKVRFILVCLMEKKEDNYDLDNKIQDKVYFHSNTHINLNSTDVKELLNKVFREIIENLNTYTKNGSGWYFKEVVKFEIHTNEYKPITASSYIPLPDWIMRKKAIVSPRNKDNKCFLWSILRYLHPREKNECRLEDLKNMNFLLTLKELLFQ